MGNYSNLKSLISFREKTFYSVFFVVERFQEWNTFLSMSKDKEIEKYLLLSMLFVFVVVFVFSIH